MVEEVVEKWETTASVIGLSRKKDWCVEWVGKAVRPRPQRVVSADGQTANSRRVRGWSFENVRGQEGSQKVPEG